MAYENFIEQNIAPYSATKIGVYDSGGNKVGQIPLTNLKPNYGTRLYRFGLLSDVHNQSDQTTENTADLQHALDYFNNKQSVSFTCICGDISQNGSESEFQLYQTNVNTKSPDTTVYTTVGNHDATTSGLNTTLWNTYTGHDRCFEFTYNTSDHFIFFGMNKYSLGSSGTPYLTTDIDWLEDKLETYRNERCFVFTHLFFPTRAGNLNNIYPSGNWLGGTELTRIQALNDRYLNSIWFSGHSHWKWYLQKYQDRANIYRNNCGWCVHVPSCASPIDSDGSSRVSMAEQSEGAIVDVYDNYIDIRGMDLKNTLYLPIAQYRLDTTLVTIPAQSVSYTVTNNLTGMTNNNSATSVEKNSSYTATLTVTDSSYTNISITVKMGGTDITSTAVSGNNINISNVTGAIVITATASASQTTTGTILTASNFTVRSTNNSTCTATDEDGYVVVTFNAKSQKFWVTLPDVDTSTTTDINVNMTMDECLVNDSTTLPVGLGFYDSDGYYHLGNSSFTIAITGGSGAQFNSSGSKYTGSVPVVIKMKNIRIVTQ